MLCKMGLKMCNGPETRPVYQQEMSSLSDMGQTRRHNSLEKVSTMEEECMCTPTSEPVCVLKDEEAHVKKPDVLKLTDFEVRGALGNQ